MQLARMYIHAWVQLARMYLHTWVQLARMYIHTWASWQEQVPSICENIIFKTMCADTLGHFVQEIKNGRLAM